MAIRSVNLGHWRALEETWLEEFIKHSALGTVAVVTAGNPQSKRLLSLAPGVISGARFFPGIPLLAEALAENLTSAKITAPQSIALAAHAGYDVNSASSAAHFFENLLENGIDAGAFEVQSESLPRPDSEVSKTAERFLKYQERRDSEFPFTPDITIRKGPVDSSRFKTVMFYGFYDLNPGQRNYIRKLASKTDILWFSPVHPSHHWRSAFQRTLDFLRNLYSRDDFHRVDGSFHLSQIARFGENLLTGKALQKSRDIHLTLCGSGTSFTKAIVKEIQSLNMCFSDIAVVSSERAADSIRTELYCSKIPCETHLKVKASELPWGRLILRLNSLADNEFHHTDIERLLATGAVTARETPGPTEYSLTAREKGARFGFQALVETGYNFSKLIGKYFRNLPEKGHPEQYLNHLTETLKQLCPESLPGYCFDSVLSSRKFLSRVDISFPLFRKMLAKALEEQVVVACGREDGVRILTPEKLRGTLFSAVILTGMEEGNFPGKTVNDPRLPVKMKELLQMPSPDNRETEEAFLLRQVFEAAAEKLVLLVRNTDEKGNSIALSPFLSPLKDEEDNPMRDMVERQTIQAMPSQTLDFPENSPFLVSSLEAQRERLLFDPDNPSPNGVHCGIIGPGYFSWNRISATMLENYIKDNFNFMVEKLWGVREQDNFPVRSEPDPLNRGTIVHNCVEKVLASEDSINLVVRREADIFNLKNLLGSEKLAEIWIKHTVQGISGLLDSLRERGWEFQGSELRLEGTIGGFPAEGRIDLVFRDSGGNLILADLKTGRPRGASAENILKEGLLQLPFYFRLAEQNRLSPISEVCYIHIEGNGAVTFEEIPVGRLSSIMDEFENVVRETAEAIQKGFFPVQKEKKWKRTGKR